MAGFERSGYVGAASRPELHELLKSELFTYQLDAAIRRVRGYDKLTVTSWRRSPAGLAVAKTHSMGPARGRASCIDMGPVVNHLRPAEQPAIVLHTHAVTEEPDQSEIVPLPLRELGTQQGLEFKLPHVISVAAFVGPVSCGLWFLRDTSAIPRRGVGTEQLGAAYPPEQTPVIIALEKARQLGFSYASAIYQLEDTALRQPGAHMPSQPGGHWIGTQPSEICQKLFAPG